MSKAIEVLEREWRKIVYTHEKEAALIVALSCPLVYSGHY
jgi:hypothetical protein